MGVDITILIEQKIDDKWVLKEPGLPACLDRSYYFFAILGLNGRYSYVKPIAELKGVPADCSAEVRLKLQNDAQHACSYLSLAELLSYNWPFEYQDSYNYYLGLIISTMSPVTSTEDVRIVFCFD